jgi:hypothetical protein
MLLKSARIGAGGSTVFSDNIRSAMVAHSAWKARLKDAITSGKSDKTVADARADNLCDFGKWLRGPDITPAVKSTTSYTRAMDLHTKFHAEAARVLEIALQGKKDAALAAMEPGSPFSRVSAELVNVLTEWQKQAA